MSEKHRHIVWITLLSCLLGIPATYASETPTLSVRTSLAKASCLALKDKKTFVWAEYGRHAVQAQTIQKQPFESRGVRRGERISADTTAGEKLHWTVLDGNNQRGGIMIERHTEIGAIDQWQFVQNCQLVQQRAITYDKDGYASELLVVDIQTQKVTATELLNPPVPKLPKIIADKQSVRVALIDSGVNYTLPTINKRLARDETGKLIGMDFWDMDDRPFDAHPAGSNFRVTRHGTKTASLLLNEAPFAELVPYRYPRPDMTRMQALVEHADANNIVIIGLPLGGNRVEEWTAFEKAAKAHPHILFIASAGNNGRNIDQQPVYPAALALDNLLVVTSADDFVQPAERVNWGRNSVDYMLPAEHQMVTDFDGTATQASGSSYAVPRAVAMAARWLKDNRHWQAPELMHEFARRFADGSRVRFVNGGYIADPLDSDPTLITIDNVDLVRAAKNLDYLMPLTVYKLSDNWQASTIKSALAQASSIFAQCNIAFSDIAIKTVSSPEYLRDLHTGSARTLFDNVRTGPDRQHAVAVFAHDTRMQEAFDGEAFGRGNTRSRDWLRDSVWLMHGVQDTGIALAHELFHVLANSGAHNRLAGNLMQTRTTPDQTRLTDEQCTQAIMAAMNNGLISKLDNN